MAIYHLEAKVISRGTGRSAVAAAAYMSCSQITNDYDGVQHDYTRKQGLVWQQVFLPDYAPQEWQNRGVLWNAVEENEKTKDSRLAREFVVALPVELTKDEWTKLLTDFIRQQFVSDGMCADVSIHDTDGHNPHAHIMLTVRPLNQDGTWQYKTEKEYLCIRDGEERGFTSTEFQEAQADGWEKQYQYKNGKKKVWLPPSEAEAQGYERVSKYPKSTKYGRQNPISARWNSDEQLLLWRAAWADAVNLYLERKGMEERIDHRSHADRGLEEQPTIHEGVVARALERQGIMSDRCEMNRQIKADNALLRGLKQTVKALTEAVKNSLSDIADALEIIRSNILILYYEMRCVRADKDALSRKLKSLRDHLTKRTRLNDLIKAKEKEHKALLAEKKNTSVLLVSKQKDLTRRISAVAEELEELRSEKAFILQAVPKDKDMNALRTEAATMENQLNVLTKQEKRYETDLDDTFRSYDKMKDQAVELDYDTLMAERLKLRPDKEQAAISRVQSASGDAYRPTIMAESSHDVATVIDEKERREAQKLLHQKQNEQTIRREKKTSRDAR